MTAARSSSASAAQGPPGSPPAGASPLVSVVVPAFEHERHIEEALLSVAGQDHPELELVVVDDASRDGTARVARRLVESDAFRQRFGGRTRLVVNDRNRGAHAAIERGLTEASGRFLAILNSDDAFAPTRIRRLTSALLESGAGLAFSAVSFMDADSAPLDLGHPDASRLRVHQARIDRAASVGFAALAGNVALSTGNLVMTRSHYDSVGGFAPLRYCHDWDFLLRSVCLAEPVYVREPLYRYRLHGRNAFRGLGAVAEEETRAVLGGYFGAVRTGRLLSPLAPCPTRWPGVFEHFLSVHGLWSHWGAAPFDGAGPDAAGDGAW